MDRYEMDAYFEKLYDSNSPAYAMPLKGERPWSEWRQEFITVLKKDLGGFPVPDGPLNARVLKEIPREGFIQRLVEYSGEDGLTIPAYLMIPERAPKQAPAIVAVCGHGAGMTEISGLTPEHQPRNLGEGYQKDFAAALCRRGFVVVAPELMGFGLRRFLADQKTGPRQSSCFRMSTNLLMMDKTMAGMRARDIMRSVDFLSSLPFVDSNRIGSMGISGGGTAILYAAALDERLKANVISGAGCTYRDSILTIFHCVDNFVPNLYSHGEMYDVLGLQIPRPLLLEAGREDDIFPEHGVQICFKQLQKAYELTGAADRIELDLFDGAHQIHGKRSYEFLTEWLG